MLLLWNLFLGCATTESECSEEIGCGFGEVCISGTCVRNSCANSSQCDMEQFCDRGSCKEGCGNDQDCYPSDYCDQELGSCQPAPCTDSHVDCAFQEYCSSISGECVPASGYFCKECESDSDCGGGGNVCVSFGLEREFCGVTCEQKSDCPSGYECFEVSGENGVSTKQCITYCWLYIPERPTPPGLPEPFVDLHEECLEVRY